MDDLKIAKIREIVEQKGGSINVTEFPHRTIEKFPILCKRGHVWMGSYKTIVRDGCWCLRCARSRVRLSPSEREANRREAARRFASKPEAKRRAKERYERIKNSPAFKERQRIGALKRKFGISASDYDNFVRIQDGKCPICNQKLESDVMVVDHCHRTGIVRGVLHRKCNSALGFLDDSLDNARRAFEYLERHNG